ncbi:hypothetical protein [Chitinophaga qingshengii]|uniref:Uncharacterized protein n=1 Tax=Chitinophaga qingshengii TaxID=1569794 RepID=A0ABR7TJX4_9BACT|nr:hypothetical protein [Chitinophaga qingshengii]MBC9930273.1 hypothetical protein [Chitinophaga qingshengii]
MAFSFFKKPLADSPTWQLVPAQPPCIHTVTIVFETAAPQTIRYNTTVQRLSYPRDSSLVFFSITRTDILINGSLAGDYLAGDLAAQCGSVIYPLQVKLENGGRIAAVPNYAGILQRWTEKKVQLERYFTGEMAETYIQHTDATLRDPEAFRQSLSRDLFLGIYFPLLFANYKTQREVTYPVIPFAPPLSFDIQQNRTPFGSVPDVIVQKGVLSADTPSLYREGQLDIKCTLTPTRHYIQQLEGKWAVREADQHHQISIGIVCMEEHAAMGK